MCVNVDKVLQRDEKLSELDDRADALQAGASVFESSAAKLKNKYWWKNCKMMIIMGVIGALVVVVIAPYMYLKFCPSKECVVFHCKMMVVPFVLDCLCQTKLTIYLLSSFVVLPAYKKCRDYFWNKCLIAPKTALFALIHRTGGFVNQTALCPVSDFLLIHVLGNTQGISLQY
ncbi:hypothetical protein HGM15179_011764 [Zosterops borbonicus]|uniref:V-SNARE coiled-coil homology domain-containing protein n=1 Tax=Zosterops borbonicus TaxID=364589 RepID=A0A8K1GC09_9PASS|nr:hypothetical protein HGM15179_011764 [Zosterops borbonicus]